MDDANAFGQDWQVLDTEPSRFHTVHPQQVCTLAPPMLASQLRRRLLEPSSVDQLATEKLGEGMHEGKEHWGSGLGDWLRIVTATASTTDCCVSGRVSRALR
jgi:hypothetical protein